MRRLPGFHVFQCSSASRKFLNLAIEKMAKDYLEKFQCSSASRKILNRRSWNAVRLRYIPFQCSSASRKFLNRPQPHAGCARGAVSVLFSEPKIPQCALAAATVVILACFSALQRAENSSIASRRSSVRRRQRVSVLFSEPKIPQWWMCQSGIGLSSSFSALQRAENSSIQATPYDGVHVAEIQCSSASRKFLNGGWRVEVAYWNKVSVLFSEPKIPQLPQIARPSIPRSGVSVLFSEPKIPQSP